MWAVKLLVFALSMALGGCTHLFFQPTRCAHSDPADAGFESLAIRFNSLDGTPLTGLFFRAAGTPRATVVHFHGNAQNMTAHYPYSAWLAAEGYNVFVFDYRGYGASGGTPSLDGLVLDGKAALAHALRLPGADPGRIVILGQSLGGAIAAASAAGSDLKPAVMILEGAFDSYRGVAASVMRSRWFTWPFFWLAGPLVSGTHSPSDAVRKLDCPKLFIHSEKDRAVPYRRGERLFLAAAPPKEFWKTPSGHIEAFGLHRPVYGPKLLEFLDNLFPRRNFP